MSSRPTLVIHSGTYKTGSTSIQHYLARAEDAGDLAAAGVQYPKVGRNAGVSHGNLNAELRGGKAFDPRWGGWDDLLASMRTSDMSTTVVSNENFSALGPDALAELGRRCRAQDIDVRWIHYVRDQPGFYNAFYVERLVALRPEFADRVNLPFEELREWSPIDLSFLRYSTFVEQVASALPQAEIVLRPFSRRHLVDDDVVADFCQVIDIQHTPEKSVSTNIGTGWRTTETARRLTPMVAKGRLLAQCRDAVNPHAARMHWIGMLRQVLVRATTEVGWNETTAVYMTESFRQRLLEEYHDDNVLVGKIGGFDFAGIVESEPVRPHNIGSYQADVDPDELLQVVQAVVPLVFNPPEAVQAMLDEGRRLRAAGPATLAARLRRRLAGR